MFACNVKQVLVRYDARSYCAALVGIVAREDHPHIEARVLAARALGHLIRLEWDCARHCLRSESVPAFLQALFSTSLHRNNRTLFVSPYLQQVKASKTENAGFVSR